MARTPIASHLREAVSVIAEAERTGRTTDEVIDARTTRRRFIAAGAGLAAAAGASAYGRWLPEANAATSPRIVVVGGGLAGLTCAYRLKQAGYTAQLHEASDRVGGRCWTIRGAFAGGQIAEHGGELIDQNHTAIRQLAQELGFTLDNLVAAEQNGTETFHWFDGQPYTYTQATNDLKQIWQQIHSDVSAASYPTLYTSYTQRGYELDHMSIADWIAAYVPGGAASKLGQLLDVAYNIEYGGESTVQSALNMLYLLGYSGQGQMRVFGPSNEKYHVTGGNDQIPAALGNALGGQVTLGSELVAIKRANDGSYTLTMNQGGRSKSVTADRVVLALPFSMLRTVDFSKAGFSQVKQWAINELGMGTNSKLHVQFNDRHWRELGCNGETYADTGYQNTWEVTRSQSGANGILVNYTGGNIGATFGSGTPSSRAQQFLSQIEPVLPGMSSRWNGKATIDYWQGYRWTRGSYSYWKVGQYTRFSGAEAEQSGACHFAGEHTSTDFQGYLNGGVESGERAASEIVTAYK